MCQDEDEKGQNGLTNVTKSSNTDELKEEEICRITDPDEYTLIVQVLFFHRFLFYSYYFKDHYCHFYPYYVSGR